jgi:flagellar basal-body rod protein FlgC
MNVFTAMEIISSGLAAERTRLNITASNLANANTTRTAEGGPYKRRDPVFESEPVTNRFQELLNDRIARQAQGVKAVEIVQDQNPPRMVYDPGHPDANTQGYVAYPNVSAVEEMVNMMMAARAYEAGTSAMQMVNGMAQAALQIGK